jgi:lipopolysaccharide biosynthesis glycosyltransferase
MKIFIGYDSREHIAAEVCRFSILRKNPNLDVTFLKTDSIPEYTRPRELQQSTDFTYTRFLVPYLSNFKGYSLFVDCDFLFLDDPEELLKYITTDHAIAVCKHPSYVPRTAMKMDGIKQTNINRKNWASLILYNNEHSFNRILTPDYINTIKPGRLLHQLFWLRDELISSIPLDWNCLDDYYYLEQPKAIHYTDGGPWFPNYQKTCYSSLWKAVYDLYKHDTEFN